MAETKYNTAPSIKARTPSFLLGRHRDALEYAESTTPNPFLVKQHFSVLVLIECDPKLQWNLF